MQQQQFNDIRDQQKTSWNKFSPGWKKWDDFNMNFLRATGDAMITALEIKKTDNVLDVACGTGEPGHTIAALAHKGKVTGTDLAEGMLDIAKENAAKKNISNYETQASDVCELAFADDHFDKISCRMGFMFFPDMQTASDEMFRVLKPGGIMATSVWATPDKNVWVTTIMAAISKHLEMPAPLPGAPGMFRCCGESQIKNIMERSGFKNVQEQYIAGKTIYKNFDEMWQMMNEVAAPVVGALSKADDATKEKIKNEAAALSKKYETEKGLALDYSSIIISGSKG